MKAGDAFIGSLTEKQKEQFEAYLTAQREVNVTDCETFCYAFWLGAKIMLDVLTDSAMKKSLIMRRGQGWRCTIIPGLIIRYIAFSKML